MQGRALDKTGRRGLADSARFLKTLIAAPRLTGAVAPSGRALARAMAAAIGSPTQGLVVELGPGTGPVTQSLIETGVPPERLVLVEYDPGFCRILEGRFGGVRVIQGDAYDLSRTLASFAGQPIAAIVSSLPLLNQPPPRRTKLVASRSLRQSLVRHSLAADPAQSAACLRVDLSARYEERRRCQGSVT
jgi:phosphatidylethanolamine/phosphatidyl-N-methylethanolamine N-methyltransferase